MYVCIMLKTVKENIGHVSKRKFGTAPDMTCLWLPLKHIPGSERVSTKLGD